MVILLAHTGQDAQIWETDNGKSPRVFIETHSKGLEGAQTVDKGKTVVDPFEAQQHENTEVQFSGSKHEAHA